MPLPRRTFIWALFCVLGLMAQPSFASELRVVASFSILADMVSEIGGEAIEVESIVGPDADAHIYQPSVSDAIAVAGADIVFVNGLGFETWASNLISESASDAVVVIATEGITPIEVDGSVDPHAWNSLENGVIYVRNIAAALGAIAPGLADQVNGNAEAYIQRLESVNRDIARRVSRLSESNRTVVTSHDAFGYLAEDYGLTFLAPKGIDTDTEPTARKLAELIEQLKNVGAAAHYLPRTSQVPHSSLKLLLRQALRSVGVSIPTPCQFVAAPRKAIWKCLRTTPTAYWRLLSAAHNGELRQSKK